MGLIACILVRITEGVRQTNSVIFSLARDVPAAARYRPGATSDCRTEQTPMKVWISPAASDFNLLKLVSEDHMSVKIID